MITVRDGTINDVAGIVALLMNISADVDWAEPDESLLKFLVQDTLLSGAVFVAVLDDEIVGSTGVEPRRWYWSKTRYLGDIWNFIHPKARSTRAAVLLNNAARDMAKRLKVQICTEALSTSDLDRKTKFYARHAGDPIGVKFLARP